MLIIKFLPKIIFWNITSANFLDIFGLIWPIIGFSAIFEFLRKDRDKWGWGGILFHFIILYGMIYCLILVIQGIIEFSITYDFFINLSVSILAWLGYFLYYD
ncbi:MAG: hypothetical protein ACTSPD_08195 [Promethearchaeota archaeon]